MTTTVRIDEKLAARIREISIEESRPIGRVIEEAILQYETEKFWREAEEAVARLRDNPVSWRAYQQEVEILDGVSLDGLNQEAPYYTAEEAEKILERRA